MWFGDLVTMGVVERDLAERGLRHVHGDAHHRRLPPGVGALGGLRPGPVGGVRHRLAVHHPADRVRGRHRRPTPRACSTSSPTRRARRSSGCSSSTSARTASRPASATTCSTHSYGNTETTDLWDAIEEATGEPVRHIMDTWIFQAGHPVVTVERQPTTGARSGSRQGRFRYDADAAADTLFAIPVVLPRRSAATRSRRRRRTVHRVLLDTPETTVDLDEPADWVRRPTTRATASTGSSYADGDLEALAARAQRDLSPLERYGLVEDEWAAVLSGAARRPTGCSSLLRHFADETDLSVWQRIVGVANAPRSGSCPTTPVRDLEAHLRALARRRRSGRSGRPGSTVSPSAHRRCAPPSSSCSARPATTSRCRPPRPTCSTALGSRRRRHRPGHGRVGRPGRRRPRHRGAVGGDPPPARRRPHRRRRPSACSVPWATPTTRRSSPGSAT